MDDAKELNSKSIAALQDLIRINIDSAKGFHTAAEKIANAELAEMFHRIGRERRTFADDLRHVVDMTDEDAEDSGSVAGAFHRWWLGVVGTVRHGDEKTLLSEAELGEDAIHFRYTKLSPTLAGLEVHDLIERQKARIEECHLAIEQMLDALRLQEQQAASSANKDGESDPPSEDNDMPGGKMKSIKNEEQYEALRDQGYSKEKAARIANTPSADRKGGRHDP
ncbi:MAG: PA2169 family four-helix-bundle protein, partial [Planctomycetota bacterium]|nr:PA2169 family four-helix-bundle protein [Planctomycetota bacterium]